MKPPPKDWPRMSASLYYDDPRGAIDWLARAFGFEPRLVVDAPDGGVAHSELTYGAAVLMVGAAGKHGLSPRNAGGPTGALFLYVDDVDAHCARAKATGAVITRELADVDYGAGYWIDRGYGCTDPEGHLWHFAQRLSDSTAP
jgi:uncharacterized glyoxalase superfamily protein PhnB